MFSSLCSSFIKNWWSCLLLLVIIIQKGRRSATKVHTNSSSLAVAEFGYITVTSSFAEANRGKATFGTKVSSSPREKEPWLQITVSKSNSCNCSNKGCFPHVLSVQRPTVPSSGIFRPCLSTLMASMKKTMWLFSGFILKTIQSGKKRGKVSFTKYS